MWVDMHLIINIINYGTQAEKTFIKKFRQILVSVKNQGGTGTCSLL